MAYHTEDVAIKMEPPLEISDSESEAESVSEVHTVEQNDAQDIGNIHETIERSEMAIGTTTYNTSMNINIEKDVGRESRENLTWEQARFIDFMSSHILQLSLPLQNEFLDGVMGLYLEISKRNH